MSNSMNPFGVRASGHDTVEKRQQCACCMLSFIYLTPRTDPRVQRSCPDCNQHRLDGTLEERNHALEEHILWHMRRTVEASAAATKYERTVRELEQADRERRFQVRAALESRDWWRSQVRAVESLHRQQGSRCTCGQQSPCRTLRVMSEATETVSFAGDEYDELAIDEA